MKFRTERGEEIGIAEFLMTRCGRCMRLGYDYTCPLYQIIMETTNITKCAKFFAEHPETAADIMGWKIIKDEEGN